MQNILRNRLHMRLPIIQAPMASGATTPALVAAVSEAGGLGTFAGGYLAATNIRTAIHKIRKLTNNAFAVNLFIPEPHDATPEEMADAIHAIASACPELHITIQPVAPPYAPSFTEQLEVCLTEKVPVLSFTFGILPKPWIQKFHDQGTVLIGTATNLAEAEELEEAGIDMVVAQGSEAGGHRGTFLGEARDALIDALALTSLLVQNLSIPVITAGGIMNGEQIKRALEKGAACVQMGTAFLCCTESGIPEQYKETLLKASGDNTTLTKVFSGKLARLIKNDFIERMQAHIDSILDYPIQNALTRPMRKIAAEQGQINFMSLFAGQNLRLCRKLSVKELMSALKKEMKEAV